MNHKIFDNAKLLPCKYCGAERLISTMNGYVEPFAYCTNQACEAAWPHRNTEAAAIATANEGHWRNVKEDGVPDKPGLYHLAEDGSMFDDFWKDKLINPHGWAGHGTGDFVTHWKPRQEPLPEPAAPNAGGE